MTLEALLQFPAFCFLDLMLITRYSLRYFALSKCYSFYPHLILFISLMDVYFPMSNDASNRFGNFVRHLTRSTSEVPRWRGCFRFIVLSISTLCHREWPVKSTFTSRPFFSQQVTFVVGLSLLRRETKSQRYARCSVLDSTVRLQAVN